MNHLIERKEIDGFPVRKVVPVSILNFVPKSKRLPREKADGGQRHDQNHERRRDKTSKPAPGPKLEVAGSKYENWQRRK